LPARKLRAGFGHRCDVAFQHARDGGQPNSTPQTLAASSSALARCELPYVAFDDAAQARRHRH
jgi:hypothetical protein